MTGNFTIFLIKKISHHWFYAENMGINFKFSISNFKTILNILISQCFKLLITHV